MSTKINKISKKDKFFMKLAFDLAKPRQGLTGENPSVGCIIVNDDNRILSIGVTGIGGRPHAEINAINSAIESLKNATIYVTLEPCIHYGKTPPCTNAIIKAGIKKVIYSIDDIDPRVRSGAKSILLKKNIIVKKNLLKDTAKNFYRSYIHNRKFKSPYVIGKIALTKNNITTSDQTKKITSIHSDKLSHFLRYKNDSILISSHTLNNDNPKLDCRLTNLKKFSPKRIVLDKNLDINLKSFVFKSISKNNTIIIYNRDPLKKFLKLRKKGAILIKMNLTKKGTYNLKLLLKKLYLYNVRNLLVEGGSKLTNSFLNLRLFNEFYLFKNNKIDPLISNFKKFDDFHLLKKIFKNKKKIDNRLNKDKIFWYN